MKAHQLINQDSGDTEYYTPEFIIEAARRVMGAIDLDPASSKEANKRVKAARYFTKKDNGLSHLWYGRVFMNHPFSKGEEVCDQETCVKKTCRERGYCCTERVPSNSEWISHLVGSLAWG